MRGRSLGKMGLGCGEEVREREFPQIWDDSWVACVIQILDVIIIIIIIIIIIFFLWKLLINVAIDMKVGEGNLDT